MKGFIRIVLSALRRTAVPKCPVSGEYVTCTVPLPGKKSFQLVIDAKTTDPVSRLYLAGNFYNTYMFETLAPFLDRRSRVLDLGGHIGTFAMAVAAAGHDVLVVDASPKHIDLLQRSVAANRFRRVRIVHAAVADQPGEVRFFSNGLYGMVYHPGLWGPIEQVQSIAVDDLLRQIGWGRVDCIKMDIEGYEGKAIEGMRGLLAQADAPVILYESNGVTLPIFGLSPGDVIRRLEDFGYQVHRVEGGRFRPCLASDPHPETWVDVVAMKPAHAARVADQIGPPLSHEEWIRKCVFEGTVPEPVQRAYIAGALQHFAPSLRDDPAIRDLLQALSQDPVEMVRQSAEWWSASQRTAA